MVLSPDFKEFIQSLNENEVEYLVVGGYAVAFHGHPRYTKDLDIWIRPSKTNAGRLIAALQQFGFGDLGLTDDDFLTPDEIIQLGYPPNRIDLMIDLKGVDFESCYSDRIVDEVDGARINIIDINGLRRNKRSTGRHQDLADLENLK